MVGHRDDDYGRLRGFSSKDLPGHVCGSTLRVGRSANYCVTSSGHRVKLLHVLFTHTGKFSIKILKLFTNFVTLRHDMSLQLTVRHGTTLVQLWDAV